MIRPAEPHKEKVPWPILRPRPDMPLKFISCSRGIFGLDTHYGNKATYPCPGEMNCERCRRGEPPRYQGYVIGTTGKEGMMAIVHLTANAALQLLPHITGVRGLLGARIVLTRDSVAQNSPVGATVFGWDDQIKPVPWERLVEIVHAIYRQPVSSKAVK